MLNLNPYFDELQKNKIVVVHNFLIESEIDKIKIEYQTTLKEKGKPYGFGEAVRLYGVPTSLPAIKELFSSVEMRDAAKAFYNKKKFKLNNAVFLTREFGVPTDAPNGHWHADLDHAFKFLIYLNDVGQDSGPFSYIPGSFSVGHKLRLSRKHQLRDWPGISNLSDKGVQVIGKAGTLIMFSTDVIHKGGRVSGGERMVIRGHCRP